MNLPLPCPPALPAATLERLEREFATYRRELPRLLAAGHAGRFALIHEDQILGVWDTRQAASQEGRRRFGLEAITVKKIDGRDAPATGHTNSRKDLATLPDRADMRHDA